MKKNIAHINEFTGEIQTIKEHSENTAELCRSYSVPELKDFMYALGLNHDVGKYQGSFSRRINGENISVEHSTCGAIAAEELFSSGAVSLIMKYCIAGHHSGIPDGGLPNDRSDEATLYGRMKRKFEDFSEYKNELDIPVLDIGRLQKYIAKDCDNKVENLIDKFAFLTRYAFSCLVDADSIDTAEFCKETQLPKKLNSDFKACLTKVNDKLNSFVCTTELQKKRAKLQQQAFKRADEDGEIYLLNMPTGSGKTLASVKIALEHAVNKNKKRIIYIAPYTSIIDQTAETFEKLFENEAEILRHQSSFSYEDAENLSEDYREAAKSATENWSADFILTTAVQFFESIHSNKRGKLRKMHNMADSVIIIDEAHLMPQKYLQPCLQAIAFITRYLNSEAIFLTATMPDFEKLLREYTVPGNRIVDLISDRSDFKAFQKCRYSYLGEIEINELIEKGMQYPSTLIVVNKKVSAQRLFKNAVGKKYHLSTYMTVFDRKRVLGEIRKELKKLEEDFPDLTEVPDDRKITIISTSLIEAGVDLDVYTVFRERTGLDSVLQAGGRCNREGKRKGAEVYIFDFSDDERSHASDERASLTKGLLSEYEDISNAKCIADYYDRLFFIKKDEIGKYAMHNFCTDINSIPFASYADQFEIIESKTISLVVPRDEKSKRLIENLKYTKHGNARELQNYTCSLYQKELEDLIKQHVVDDYGTGIYCLTNKDYYDDETGIQFEAKDYIL